MDSCGPETDQRSHHSIQEGRVLSPPATWQQLTQEGHAGVNEPELRQSADCRRSHGWPGVHARDLRGCLEDGRRSSPPPSASLLRPGYGWDDCYSERTTDAYDVR